MSRLCAKPTCSDVAERWFDVSAAQCQVVERPGPTPSTIALCGAHAARFSAPSGWGRIGLALEAAPTVSESDSDTPTQTAVEARDPAPANELEGEVDDTAAPTDPPRRRHTRDAPWFLANSNAADARDLTNDAPDPAPDAGTQSSSVGEDSDFEVPSTGSLLHRAFHGPDREADSARALEAERDSNGRREPRTKSTAVDADDDGDVATVDDLASRRNARTPAASYDVELPFPPLDAEPHVAVS